MQFILRLSEATNVEPLRGYFAACQSQRINEEILENERPEYGQQIVVSLSRQLELVYGKGYSEKNLRRAMQFK